MKFISYQNYLLIISPLTVKLFGWFTGQSKLSRAVTIFPFIFVRSEDVVEPWLINHELIHFRQQVEFLFVGSFIIRLVEIIYFKLVKQLSWVEVYKLLSSEQEAYLNQDNLDYLKKRKLWAMSKYIFHKNNFDIEGPNQIIIKN